MPLGEQIARQVARRIPLRARFIISASKPLPRARAGSAEKKTKDEDFLQRLFNSRYIGMPEAI